MATPEIEKEISHFLRWVAANAPISEPSYLWLKSAVTKRMAHEKMMKLSQNSYGAIIHNSIETM